MLIGELEMAESLGGKVEDAVNAPQLVPPIGRRCRLWDRGRVDDVDQAAAACLRRGGGQRLPDQERRNGAMIAGIGTPWGFASGDGNLGYHLVWSRDMYKFANALITAGDSASAASAVNWLFNHDIEPNAGRFPQNAFVNGTPFRDAVQMDEQAMPIVLAYRLGPAVYNPLWPQIRKIANFIYGAGPWTEQERWEETSGYSPSTIAAEIAGLVDAAQIALANNDPADAANWLNAADDWQQNIAGWTYTSQGCPNVNSNCNSTQMYMRINTSGAEGGSPPGSWNPPRIPIRI